MVCSTRFTASAAQFAAYRHEHLHTKMVEEQLEQNVKA